ncbi:hypothetical protein AB4166_18040 [Vibrio splendidus]|uniref:hypothetical protein n=1 Tax=Vibrio TaxID=662 RepID=UPI000808E3D4|nr:MULTISPECIES: hypothetical protein [Vibrio]MCT4348010.1 hypothetical protein [Vibrio sp. NC2]SBS60084.1 hypothetical protein VHE8714_00001 [Vibrio splendidus]
MISELAKMVTEWNEDGYFEGELLSEPEWYVLWNPDDLEEINNDYLLSKYAPGFTSFGGNGGGELLVVNTCGEVFYLPEIGMSPEVAVKIAPNLNKFKELMKK